MCHYKMFSLAKKTLKHMDTIGIHLSLNKSAFYEHRCLKNIKNVYKYFGKRDHQQQYKSILGDALVSTPE